MADTYELIEVTAPTVQLATLAEAKAAARVLHDDEDDRITLLIAVASEWIDGPFSYTGCSWRQSRWIARWPAAPGGASPLVLPFGPVSALVSVKVHDGTTLQTQTLADYELIASRWLATVQPDAGKAWPVAVTGRRDAFQVEFDVGLATVPLPVKQAVLLQVALWFDQVQDIDKVSGLSPQVENLLVNYRRFV
jgi:uncharacterized phiE125 gp8 family phage protein